VKSVTSAPIGGKNAMHETKKRLFIAIHLPKEILQKLEEVQQNFKRFAPDAKWVNVHSIHLTLRFLGYVDPSIISAIQESMSNLSKQFAPVSITLKGCDFFPNSRRPSVFWTGVDSKDLLPIQQQIEDATQKLGLEKEERTFNPHLTLARFRNSHGLIHLVEEARKFQETVFGEFVAKSFILFESILHREGAEYIRIQEFTFKL
jgi:RNA 2',3'-cyclic 3'-phosphodiesterase